MIRTHQQLQALIDSFDGTPADLERIAANPVSSIEQLARLFEGIETEAEAQALVRANPRWAAELAEAQAAYNRMTENGAKFAAISDAADPARLIAALTPREREEFVWLMSMFPPDATEAECGEVYYRMVDPSRGIDL